MPEMQGLSRFDDMPLAPDPVTPREFLTVAGAAEVLGVSPSTRRHPVNSYRPHRRADRDVLLCRLTAAGRGASR